MTVSKQLSSQQTADLIGLLEVRFMKNMFRHQGMDWMNVKDKLLSDTRKLWSLNAMEQSGGEPDVIGYEPDSNTYTFVDCVAESPKGRRSLCYDRAALDARKEFKPENSALDMAAEMGIELLNEQQYADLQKFGKLDTKTSCWIKTPDNIRKLGGALFCEYRYGHVFVFHNGAQSYYAARGFRGLLRI